MNWIIKQETLSIFVIFIAYSACTFKQNKSENIPKGECGELLVNLDSITTKVEDLRLSSFFKPIVKTIILETNTNALIGAIDKMQKYKDKIIVLDRNIAKSVFVFEENGRFVRKVGQEGRGVGDYLRIGDFTIDEDNDAILILDIGRQKILTFDIEPEEYNSSKEISISHNPTYISRSIEWISGHLYADVYCYKDDETVPLLRKIDLISGAEIKTYYNLTAYNKRSHRKMLSPSPFKRYNPSSILFFHPYMNSVLEIKETQITPLVTISGKDIFTADELVQFNMDDPINDFSIATLFIKKISGIGCCYLYLDKIFLNFQQGTDSKSVLIDTSTSKGSYRAYIMDDIVYKEGCGVYFNPMYATQDGVYNICSGAYLSELIKAVAKNGLSSEIDKQLFERLTEESNPVLFYYEFK